MRVLSIGDCVRPGTYTVHSRFHRVVHYACGPRRLFLALEGIGAGPLTLLLAGRRVPRIERIIVSKEQIVLDGQAFPRAGVPRYDSRAPDTAPPHCAPPKQLAALKRMIAEEAAPDSLAFLLRPQERPHGSFEQALRNRLARGASLVQQGLKSPARRRALFAGIRQLKGCGCGLTPAGDDFIAGVLAAINSGRPSLRARQIARAAMGNNPLSNAFLCLAGQGRLSAAHKGLLEALPQASPARLRARIRGVLDHGATSGADWAAGFVLALEAQQEESPYAQGR